MTCGTNATVVQVPAIKPIEEGSSMVRLRCNTRGLEIKALASSLSLLIYFALLFHFSLHCQYMSHLSLLTYHSAIIDIDIALIKTGKGC